MIDFKNILSQFSITGDIKCKTAYGEGHINDTYYVRVADGRYILQRINKEIFKNPPEIMRNIEKITAHLRKKIVEKGGDPARETLTIIPTKSGQSYYKSPDGNYYRIYTFITGAKTYQSVQKPADFYNAGKAFGIFQKMLSDFPAAELFVPIADFHNTKVRFENLLNAVNCDKAGRVKYVQSEIDFALQRQSDVNVLVDLIEKGDIPLRVTHNDTKYNNIMIDDITGEGVCIIDLDTVMPGSLLYDFGDSIRFGASNALEDERDLSKVYMDNRLYEAFVKGFFGEVGKEMTEAEVEHAPFSAKLMTYECGMRFLTDYLNGDVYFKIHRPKHNLDRARAQFKLVSDMEKKMDYMREAVMGYVKTGV
ncbi:MAG: aminoglycoside phosphotransferase family protein [Firmicutes bacterium]|nr:aminoglycoside phosphotransferase family protein [Bacillota bacterium]